jgi:hypothetical protein
MQGQWQNNYQFNPKLQKIFHTTKIVRKPISGIISGYHELPYILVGPSGENTSHTVEINGKISVSPKFIISSASLQESFGDVFDPETFAEDIQGRLFSFAFTQGKNLKVQSNAFSVTRYEETAQDHLEKVLDVLQMRENVHTGLIFGPDPKYYPISLDRFINEILDREFNV